MAEQVDGEGCTADQWSLLTGMGVQAKKNTFSSSASSPPPPAPGQKQYPDKEDFSCEVDVKKNGREKETYCRCRGRDGQGRQNGVWGLRQLNGGAVLIVVVALLSGVNVLLSIFSCFYVLHHSRTTTLEVEELRETVQRLDARCAKDATPPFTLATAAAQQQHPRALSDRDTSAPALQHSAADRPAGVMHSYGPEVFDKNVEAAHGDVKGYATGEEERGDSSHALFVAKSRQKRAEKKKKRRNNKCKNLVKCIKEKETKKKVRGKCAKMLKCLPPPATPAPAPVPALKPVHFMGTFANDRQKQFGKEAPLHFNAKADWMKVLYNDANQQPIVRLGDRGFNVTQSGVYFVYTSVMFHDVKPRQSQAVVVNGRKRLKCMDSVDYVNRTLKMESQRKYKTCAISGLLYLRVSDRLEVQNLYAQTEIDQSEDATYFGAILLVPLQL